jgi:hypothetical protein
VVKLPTGWKGSFYENIEGDSTYATFFDSVRNDLEPRTENSGNDGGNG